MLKGPLASLERHDRPAFEGRSGSERSTEPGSSAKTVASQPVVGYRIRSRTAKKEILDPRFQLWVARYFEGDWDVDNGVLMRLGQVIRELNALCECAVGVPLFKCQDLGGLHFPVAENNHRFVDAHAVGVLMRLGQVIRELNALCECAVGVPLFKCQDLGGLHFPVEAYKHIVDELDKVAIKRIGLKCGKLLNLDSDRTLNALEKVLPSPMAKKVLEPLKKVAEQRRLAGHGARPNAKKFPAFERFNQDMTEVLNGLQGFETFLSQLFQVDPDSCVKRVEAMRRLPRLDASRPAQPNYSIWQIASARGKRISKVEFGYQEPVDQDFLFGRPGAYTIADYRLRCNGFRTAARFGTPFAAAPAFECWPIMAFQRSQRAL